jgi:hypothetical protein
MGAGSVDRGARETAEGRNRLCPSIEAAAGRLDYGRGVPTAASHDERQVIADEARDLLAHDLALLGIQLRAARVLLDDRPDAVAALGLAEMTCSAALWRLRRLSRLLTSQAPVRYAPQEVSLDLDELRSMAAAAGAALETAGEDHLADVPGDVALSVRRIAELLFSPGARVRIRGHELGVRLTARDAPRDQGATARIRERVTLLSGTARWASERMTIDLPAPRDELAQDALRSYASARDQRRRR